MRAGKSAPDALGGLLGADKSSPVRQVAMIDSNGDVATFTGCKDIQAAGEEVRGKSIQDYEIRYVFRTLELPPCGTFATGTEFSVQANLMSNDQVWPAMAKGY